jgi:F0F1-type ATP synthase gamma subunit
LKICFSRIHFLNFVLKRAKNKKKNLIWVTSDDGVGGAINRACWNQALMSVSHRDSVQNEEEPAGNVTDQSE